MEKKVKLLDYATIDDFLKSVVEGGFTIKEAVELVYINKTLNKDDEKLNDLRARRFISADGRKDVVFKDMVGANYTFANCCYPLPKEDIVGIIDKDNLVIHRVE